MIADIRKAFETKLNTLAGLPTSVAYENVTYDPEPNQTFLRTSLQPDTRRATSLGGDALYLRLDGLFGINVFTPQDQGPAQADDIADTLCHAFKCGQRLTFNGKHVIIRYSERKSGRISNTHYQVPVIIGWYAYEQQT